MFECPKDFGKVKLGNVVVVHADIICRQWEHYHYGMLPSHYVICRTVFNLINSQADLFHVTKCKGF